LSPTVQIHRSTNSRLFEQAAHDNTATDGRIVVVLLQDVPAAVRDHLTCVN
jgi:hypothetical protein